MILTLNIISTDRRINLFEPTLMNIVQYYNKEKIRKSKMFNSIKTYTNADNLKGYHVIPKQFNPNIGHSSQIWFVSMFKLKTLKQIIEVISTYIISNNEREQYDQFVEWKESGYDFDTNNIGISFLEKQWENGVFTTTEYTYEDLQQAQNIMIETMYIINSGGSFYKTTKSLNKIHTPILYKRKALAKNTLGILMISGLVSKSERYKIYKEMTLDRNSDIRYNMRLKGLTDRTDCMKVLKLFAKTIGKDIFFSEHVMSLYYNQTTTQQNDFVIFGQSFYLLVYEGKKAISLF